MSPRTGTSRGSAGRARVGERGFALPLVVMLTLVVVVIVAAMLGRQGTESIMVARENEAVRDWHFSRGVKEIVDQWLKNKAINSVRDTLGADGHAFDLVFDDGTRMRLFLADAQGTLLSVTTGLTADETLDVAGALSSLRQNAPASGLARFTREVGPPEVSLWTASPEVLSAVCGQVAGADGADALARLLIDLRQTKEKATAGDLREATVKLNLGEGKMRSLTRMIAVEPSMFRFVLDVVPPMTGQPSARYTGYLVARSSLLRAGTGGGAGGAGGRTASAPVVRSAFLSWEKVPVR